jgi:predicted DNA-binding protein with PD1-like motif
MITAKGRPYQLHVLRMLPGEDVRTGLEEWCKDNALEAGCVVSAVGSLSRAVLRMAGRSDGSTLTGDMEICSLSGTLSRHGMHLHMAVGDAEGRMHGGHLLAGCTVRTTLEEVVQEIGGLALHRRPDARTGYPELFPEVRP